MPEAQGAVHLAVGTSSHPRSLADVDLVDLITRETGVSFLPPVGAEQVAKGPCPWCGGTDRFGIVTSARPHRFYCGWHGTGCHRRGNAVTFLQEWYGWSRAEAAAMLGCWDAVDRQPAPSGSRTSPDGREPGAACALASPPPACWQEAARALVDLAQRWLHSERGAGARAYLARRGLRAETTDRLKFGFLPGGVSLGELARPATWGLPWRDPERSLVLPAGILIPWEGEGQIWRLSVRRVEPAGPVGTGKGGPSSRGRYWTMPGSRVCFYGLDALHEGRPIILVEGELDVATLLQEADTLVAPLGTGGTAGVRHPEWVTRLQRQAAPVLVAFDHDAGQGDAAARYWLEALGARAWRWRPIGKDVNEMLQQGQDLRAWVETGVRLAQTACLHQREEARPAPGEEKQAGTRVAEEPNPEARLTPDSPAGALQPGLRSGAPTEPTERKPAMEAIPTPEPERCHCCRAEAEWSDPYDRPCCGAHVLPWDLTPLVEQGVFTRLEAAGSWEPLVRFVLEASCAGTGTYSEEETERNAFVALQLYELQLQIQAGASLGIDCETTGLSPRRDRLITVTFGQPGRIFLLDLRPFWTWPDPEQARWKREIQTLFVLLAQAAAPQHPLTWVGHNLKFDLQFLAEQLGVLLIPRGTSNTTVRPHDTMLVEQVLQNGRASGSVSLEAVASRYGLAVSKAERPWFVGLDQRPAWREPLPEDQQRYLVQDVLLPLEIMARQLPQIRQERVERVVELEMEALPAVAEMERHGVCIDQESWQACSRAVQEELARQEVELTRSLGEVWSRWQASQPPRIPVANPARVYQPALEALVPPSAPAPARADAFSLHSLEQVRVVLSVICGTPIEATREEALAPYADRPDVRHYLAWKKLQHFHTTFGEEFLRYVEADGRIHADFRQLGARSGRLICQRPNLQQLPRRPLLGTVVGEGDLRRCIVAPPGAKLVTADLSNIELRILAEVSQDAQLLAAFAAGKDVHSETARLVFGLPEGTDPRQERWGQSCLSLREIAKTINFGLIYGMGPASLAQRIGVSLEEARQLMRRFAAQYPRLDAWVRQASRQALRQGVSRSLGGRPRWFPEQERRTANRAALERAARNHPIQGTNADILKRALALLWQRLPPGVVVVLAVHDEIVLECPEDRVEEASQVLRETLRAACKDFLKTVEVPEPEVVVAPWWSKEGHPQGKETQ